MAFIHYRRGGQKVYVYFHDKSTDGLVQVPRDQTKHLDGKPREEAEAWVRRWEAKHGQITNRAARIHVHEDDQLMRLWTRYQAHRAKTSRRREGTAQAETDVFLGHIAPFFVGQHQKKDPALWHDLVPAFHDFLFQKYSDRTIQKTLWTLERFGKHLVFARYMTFPFAVQIPARGNPRVTPLKVRKSPAEILSYVRRAKFDYDIDFRLAILLGYFAALGPQELFALEKSDFLTGASAELQTKTLPGFRAHSLGSRLSVVMNKTLVRKHGVVPLAKNDYRMGVVNIWHPEAARQVAEILKNRPAGRLFDVTYDAATCAWSRMVQPTLEVTPHDLRRASALYLGRELRIELTLLQEHMRHAEIETTMLYTREPEQTRERKIVRQNFDDVA